ncbi:MAG TPA: type VI secretion system baseplate subunit TssE [Pseudomonas sp.]
MQHSGLLPPLFERLSAQADETPGFDSDDLAESVRLELVRLLNTRSHPRFSGRPLTVLDYGISDWSALQALRVDDRQKLLRELRAAVQHFEPRLQLSEIDVEALPSQPQRLGIRLAGQLRSGCRAWPALFLLTHGGDNLEVCLERLD